MSIASIVPMSAIPEPSAVATADLVSSSQQMLASGDTKNGVFDTLLEHIEGVNTQMINTDNMVQQLANGGTDNLHQVMISLEQTRLTFDLLLQVRNKVLDAYQEIMRMQV